MHGDPNDLGVCGAQVFGWSMPGMPISACVLCIGVFMCAYVYAHMCILLVCACCASVCCDIYIYIYIYIYIMHTT